MASSVEKRIALAFPVLRMDRFCGVMSTAAARSFSRILRWARTTSKMTMMGINLNGQFLFLLNLPALVHDPGDQHNDNSGEKQSKIYAGAEIKREESQPITTNHDPLNNRGFRRMSLSDLGRRQRMGQKLQ